MTPFIPYSKEEQQQMLRSIGVSSVGELFSDIPDTVKLTQPLSLPAALSEPELVVYFQELAAKNLAIGNNYLSFLGAGAYDHFIPAAVDTIISRSEFYTAYTPYQAEASQGTLQTIYEYQSMLCALTGMDVANASMYDGATAVAEAALMATRYTNKPQVLVARTVHPQYREVLKTYCHTAGISIVEIPYSNGIIDLAKLTQLASKDTAAVIIQHPNFLGCLEPVFEIDALVHQSGGLLISCVNPISLGLLASPNEFHTDITVMEGQPLGIPLQFGGPYLGILACKQELMRFIPGRLVGMTKDTKGNRGFVLTLQTREQHIRRQKAVSNICSNQALIALAATVYLSLFGKQGLKEVAELNLQKTNYAKQQLDKLSGFKVLWKNQPVFNEFAVQCPIPANEVNKRLLDNGIIGGYPLEKHYPELKDSLLFCITEKRIKAHIDSLISTLNK